MEKKHRFTSLTCRTIGASLIGATRWEKLLTADDLESGLRRGLMAGRKGGHGKSAGAHTR